MEKETKVTVYSNLPEVELFVNGKSLGKKKSEEHFFYFLVPNEGESVLTAVAGDCRDESRICKVEVFPEEYRLKEQGAVLNWFDITEKEGFFSLNDKMGDILKSPEGRALFDHVFQQLGGIMGSDDASMLREENQEAMLQMLSGFTALRLFKLLSAAHGKLTKEQMLAVNEKLNQIRK